MPRIKPGSLPDSTVITRPSSAATTIAKTPTLPGRVPHSWVTGAGRPPGPGLDGDGERTPGGSVPGRVRGIWPCGPRGSVWSPLVAEPTRPDGSASAGPGVLPAHADTACPLPGGG